MRTHHVHPRHLVLAAALLFVAAVPLGGLVGTFTALGGFVAGYGAVFLRLRRTVEDVPAMERVGIGMGIGGGL